MQKFCGIAISVIEVAILTALILLTRCANYRDVFVAGNIYFTDADCYARMTRVRLCAQHPGTILRHHDFENFPIGTAPHTTVPLDYLILFLSLLLRPFTDRSIDLAGALVSPFLALGGGWFLWWWSRQMRFRFRWALLILYAISPILVQGTELGRPDHQSLSILLVTIALCATWSRWSVLSGVAWGLAIWVSAYEPLVLFLLTSVVLAVHDRSRLIGRDGRAGWIGFAAIIAMALLIERRIPKLPIFHSSDLFQNWSHTIGELHSVTLVSPIWFSWGSYLILLAPVLLWIGYRKKNGPPVFLAVLLLMTFCLTMSQARWAYFFFLIWSLSLPALFESFRSRPAVWVAFVLSIFPILREWDARLWPNESTNALQIEHRREQVELHDIAHEMMSNQVRAFLAPWWLSPSVAYWSGQPGVAGSSHEGLDGIADSARFFLTGDPEVAREILVRRKVASVVSYHSDRVALNSAQLLGGAIPDQTLGRALDRTPGQVPRFLTLVSQNGTAKLFEVGNNR